MSIVKDLKPRDRIFLVGGDPAIDPTLRAFATFRVLPVTNITFNHHQLPF